MMNLRFNDAYWQRQRDIPILSKTANSEQELINTLNTLEGVDQTRIEGQSLHVEYDLRATSLRAIKQVVAQHSLSIKTSIWASFRDLIIEYRESILRAEQGIDYGWDVWIQDAYVSRYRLRRHGRRDDRVTHWRMYERHDENTKQAFDSKTSVNN